MPNSQAIDLAGYLKFKPTGETVQGALVFKRGRKFISADQDGHNGGIWKMADSVRALGSKTTRMGTYTALLHRIGQ